MLLQVGRQAMVWSRSFNLAVWLWQNDCVTSALLYKSCSLLVLCNLLLAFLLLRNKRSAYSKSSKIRFIFWFQASGFWLELFILRSENVKSDLGYLIWCVQISLIRFMIMWHKCTLIYLWTWPKVNVTLIKGQKKYFFLIVKQNKTCNEQHQSMMKDGETKKQSPCIWICSWTSS